MPRIENVQKIYAEHEELFKRKLHDYGTADITEVGFDGVVSRLVDKFARLKNLHANRKESGGLPNLEAIEDTLMDLVGYSIIALLLERGQWDENDEKTYAGIRGEVGAKATESVEHCLLIKRDDPAKVYDLPTPKKAGDVGYDLTVVARTVIPRAGNAAVHVPSGLAMKLPKGHWAEIRPRSSAAKRGIIVVPCVIDEGYTGPLYAQAYNITELPIVVEVGERIAQVVLHRSSVPKTIEVDVLPETERGATGFGSTGK